MKPNLQARNVGRHLLLQSVLTNHRYLTAHVPEIMTARAVHQTGHVTRTNGALWRHQAAAAVEAAGRRRRGGGGAGGGTAGGPVRWTD